MIKRTIYLNQIKPFMKTDLIKIITGIRRSGKSTLMRQLISSLIEDGVNNNQIIYLNFEDYQIKDLKNPDKLFEHLKQNIYKKGKTYIFLDEIQEVVGFEQVINSFRATEDVDIYLTGSNSKMLSGEYATLLTGRYKSFNIFPLSFKELVDYYKPNNKDDLMTEYIKFGGFPILLNFKTEFEKLSILRDLYDSIVIKDLVQRHNIVGIDTLDKYMNYLLNTISSQFSAKNIINYFKNEGRTISKETLYSYISYAKEVLMIYSAKRYDLNGKKLLTTNEKYFINDQGLRATKFSNQKDIEKILENIVYFELLRREYDVSIGMINDREIDFIAQKNGLIEYYQVTYLMETEKTREREFGALLLVGDQYPKYVLSMDNIDFSQQGIVHKNIINFLLE